MDLVAYLGEMWGIAAEGKARGIYFFAALYTLVALGYSYLYQGRIASWPSTKGRLVGAGVNRFGATTHARTDQEYALSARYRYSVGGKEYIGTRISPWLVIASHNARFVLEWKLKKIDRYEDGSVRVFFNPGNPARSFLARPGIFSRMLTLALAAAPLLLYWLKYHV